MVGPERLGSAFERSAKVSRRDVHGSQRPHFHAHRDGATAGLSADLHRTVALGHCGGRFLPRDNYRLPRWLHRALVRVGYQSRQDHGPARRQTAGRRRADHARRDAADAARAGVDGGRAGLARILVTGLRAVAASRGRIVRRRENSASTKWRCSRLPCTDYSSITLIITWIFSPVACSCCGLRWC